MAKDEKGHGSDAQDRASTRLQRFVANANVDSFTRQEWMGAHPKSAPVPVHGGMSRLASDPIHRTSPIDGQYFK